MKFIPTVLIALTTVLTNADTVRFYFENDCPFGDDSDYTNGARLEYQYRSFNIFLEQLMYSPENIKVSQYIPGYHPYAGFLGVGSGYTFSKELSERLRWNNYIELETGMVGPSSLAEDTQKTIHKIIGAHDPNGWNNQLHDEWEIQSVVWTGLEFLLFGDPDKWNFRIEDEIGGYLGTMQIAAGNNFNIKFGYNSNHNRRPGNIEVRASQTRKVLFYALVGNETRWWGWNVFLDGNRDGDSYSVDKEVWTTALKTGLVAEIGRLELGWFVLFNSREYKTQNNTPNYMSFQVGCKF